MTQFQEVVPDILFLDNNLPDGIGWEKAAGLIEQYPGLQVHLISAYQPAMEGTVMPSKSGKNHSHSRIWIII